MQKAAPFNTVSVRPWLASKKAKKAFNWCRWLHIYISCALFSLLLFFCISGVTLNHPNWTEKLDTTSSQIILPSALTLPIEGEIPVRKIQAFIEKVTNLSNPRSVDMALDIGELTYDYPLPAGYVFVTVLLDEQIIEVEHAKSGVIGLVNDLHKGRHSGTAWSWLIDVSAILMIFFTITGVIILLQNAKHRRNAVGILILGSFTPVVIYLLSVPYFVP